MTVQRPIDTVRMGAVQAAIWRNEHDGRTRYGVTLERTYRDTNGDSKSSKSFWRDDLLRLGKVLSKAETRIFELEAEDRRQAEAGVETGVTETDTQTPAARGAAKAKAAAGGR